MKNKTDILNKVSRIYRKYGIKSVTMDDVARELGISKRTLYQHVTNKHELVEEVVNHEVSLRASDFYGMTRQGVNAIDELLEVNRHIIQMLKAHNPSMEYDLRKYYPDLNKKIQSFKRKTMYGAIYKNIKKGQQEGIFRKDLNPDIIARLQVSRIECSMETDLFSLEELTSPDFVFESFIYHIHGIANRKGLDILEERLQEIDKKQLLYENPENSKNE